MNSYLIFSNFQTNWINVVKLLTIHLTFHIWLLLYRWFTPIISKFKPNSTQCSWFNDIFVTWLTILYRSSETEVEQDLTQRCWLEVDGIVVNWMIRSSRSWELMVRFESSIQYTHLWWCAPSRTAVSWERSSSFGCNRRKERTISMIESCKIGEKLYRRIFQVFRQALFKLKETNFEKFEQGTINYFS